MLEIFRPENLQPFTTKSDGISISEAMEETLKIVF